MGVLYMPKIYPGKFLTCFATFDPRGSFSFPTNCQANEAALSHGASNQIKYFLPSLCLKVEEEEEKKEKSTDSPHSTVAIGRNNINSFL